MDAPRDKKILTASLPSPAVVAQTRKRAKGKTTTRADLNEIAIVGVKEL